MMSEDEVWSVYLRFNRRLKAIGISISCSSNVPWIYLEKVNGKRITEQYMGNHGFTAFWYPVKLGDKVQFSDRRKVFAKVREMINE